MARSIAFLILLTTIAGCGRQICEGRRSIESFRLVQANFDEASEVSFCKGGRNPRQVSVTIAQGGSVKLAESYVKYRTSEPQAVCGEGSDVQELVPVALTSKSFAEYKLCYEGSAKTAVLIVNLRQACPDGTTEQTAAVDDCRQL